MSKPIILSTNEISQDKILLVACSLYEAIMCIKEALGNFGLNPFWIETEQDVGQ